MAIITKPNTFTDGTVAVAGQVNSNFDTIYSDYNGNITNANLAAGAAIVDSKLSTITTAGKVNISALTVASQATGDIIYASSASAWARLAVGTATQVLHGGTTPAFSALVSADLPTGSVVQIVNTQTGAVATGTTTVPDDDTIPQNTEGDQYMTLAITPKATTNNLLIEVHANFATGAGADIPLIIALFQDTTVNALAAVREVTNTTNNYDQGYSFSHFMAAGTTSATTFKVRAGTSAAGTTTFNGAVGARKLGGVIASSITITEVKA